MNAALPPPLLFATREARLAALDTLPRPLWLGSMINAEGRVEPRLDALRVLADRLLHGALPADAPWPDADLPGETRGIRRSGRFARMLPAEALLLVHPRLRLVWHARHAERALMTYEDDDRHAETSHDTVPALRVATRREPERRREMGPMLICVDTSGSMQGGAEAVAKACALEAARTAHAQGRACHLFAFGGPGEVVETSLKLDAKGIGALTEFLGQGFRGGTDICGPIERAVERLREEQWQLADLVIASDGDFGATPQVAAALAAMKAALGVRVQGVLIGDRETIGLLELADEVFWVRDWRRFGGAEHATAVSPVHSKSLTAEYFPGALRGTAQAPPTVNPAEGAKALWPAPKK